MPYGSVLTLHTASTLAMVGLIWFVQVVHYPLFQAVGRDRFRSYERQHQSRTTWIVAPLMLTELATASALALWPGPGHAFLARFGLGLVILIWASTAFVQVPLHRRLGDGFEIAVARRLVLTNWLRTAAWTLRGVVALLLAA